MKKLLGVALLLVALQFTGMAEKTDTCDVICKACGKEPCGPAYNKLKRTHVHGAQLQTEPYSAIVLQSFNRLIHSYASTGSFIAPNALITAYHAVKNPQNVVGATFSNYAVPGTCIYFKKREFIMIPYKTQFATQTDIAIIIFKDPKKIAPIYKSQFSIGTRELITDPNLPVHLTGCPCDSFNVLMDKSTPNNTIIPDADCPTVLGYDMYTCTGDSGAPLWAVIDGKPTIIGIHHGGKETFLASQGCLNISAKIDAGVVSWINSVLAANPVH